MDKNKVEKPAGLRKQSFRLSEKEAAYLQNAASKNSMSMSKYIRMLIDADMETGIVEKRRLQNLLRRDLINEVNHIGVNINQITRSHNENLYSEHDKRKLFALMKKLNEMVGRL
ncbi:plasmid mobilization relaxosome protein MobC [Lachnospiraceae bacterium 48-33]